MKLYTLGMATPIIFWKSTYPITLLIIGVIVLLSAVIYFGYDTRQQERQDFSQEQAAKNFPMVPESVIALAQAKINEDSQRTMAIKQVKETSNGWVFFYDSEEALRTGDWQKYGVPGNIPLYIGKDGSSKYLPNPNDPLLEE
jgi:hypothetical protein